MELTNLTLKKILDLGGVILTINELGKTKSAPVDKALLQFKDTDPILFKEGTKLVVLFFYNSNQIHGLYYLGEDQKVYEIIHNSFMV